MRRSGSRRSRPPTTSCRTRKSAAATTPARSTPRGPRKRRHGPVLPRICGRGGAPLRERPRFRRLRRGRRPLRRSLAASPRAGAARARRRPPLRAARPIPRRGERRDADDHPAARRNARRKYPGRRRGRAGLAPARQGRAFAGRRPAGRRPGADRRRAAPLLHPRGRRHPRRVADHHKGSGARRGSAAPRRRRAA